MGVGSSRLRGHASGAAAPTAGVSPRRFAGTPTACVSCHLTDFNKAANPNHAAAGFPQDCTLCHTTTQWAGADTVTWEEYQKFGVPYDLEIIKAAEPDAFNLLHVCSSNNYLRELSELDYNARLVNWEACDPTNLPLDKAESILKNKVMVGGAPVTAAWAQSIGAERIRPAEHQTQPTFARQALLRQPPA